MHEVADELDLSIDGPLVGGEHGAVAVSSTEGRRLVLKVFPEDMAHRLRRSVEVVAHVRARGMPVPWPYEAGVAAGAAFTLQERRDGDVPVELNDAHAAQLLELWELHRDVNPDATDWPTAAVAALVDGDPELWADHRPVRAAGGRAAELLDEIIDVGATVNVADLRATDALHGDWHHRNLLVDGDVVTAIIDWEAARWGDARYDLCYLTFWASVFEGEEVAVDATLRIRHAAEVAVPVAARTAVSALIALHQLWFVSAHRPERLDDLVELVDRHLRPFWTG